MDKIKKIIKEIYPYFLVILIVIVVKTYIFTPVIVNGKSMMNTLHDHDIMILDKVSAKVKGIERFDIVVIQTGNTKIIKRIIGLPGETIEYKENQLYINHKKIKDTYGSDITYDIPEQKIPENTYYVLGDNRTDSVDSRILGFIPKSDILGKATFIIYPFNRIGKK